MGVKEDFVSLLLRDDMLSRLNKTKPNTRAEYAQLVENGGYPDAQGNRLYCAPIQQGLRLSARHCYPIDKT
jgi:hypothetical protein